MVSKPLHIKRFKKALADYRQSMNHNDIEHSLLNSSYSTVLTHRLSADEPLYDRNLLSSLITSTSMKNSPKPINQISSNWCINVCFHLNIFRHR